jgi:phage head maturation protease
MASTETAKPPRDNLYRGNNTAGAFELRANNEGGPVLSGHAAVFNTWTEINSAFEGRFLERLAPGAFAKTISENRDRIRVLFQHGKDPQIGDKPLGPLRTLEEDAPASATRLTFSRRLTTRS